MRKKKFPQLVPGMTLVELMVVVVIIIFLVLLGLWFFRKQIFRGNDAKRKADLHNIKVALDENQNDNDCYPLTSALVCGGAGLSPYLSEVPCDPVTEASYYYEHQNSSCPQWYRLFALLEDEDFGAFGPNGSYNYQVSSPNAPPTGFTEADFYGCKSGLCVPIFWDSARPGPECDPNYQNPSCYGQCSNPSNECQYWNQ